MISHNNMLVTYVRYLFFFFFFLVRTLHVTLYCEIYITLYVANTSEHRCILSLTLTSMETSSAAGAPPATPPQSSHPLPPRKVNPALQYLGSHICFNYTHRANFLQGWATYGQNFHRGIGSYSSE